eukprot:356154-Chlamydomonas_euryale.AAC.3
MRYKLIRSKTSAIACAGMAMLAFSHTLAVPWYLLHTMLLKATGFHGMRLCHGVPDCCGAASHSVVPSWSSTCSSLTEVLQGLYKVFERGTPDDAPADTCAVV